MTVYAKGKIYMIESASTGLTYYGSTCSRLSQRFSNHKSKFNQYKVGKYHYVSAFDVLSNADAKIVLVESFSSNSKSELIAREAYYIRNNQCVNKNIPGRSMAEYYIDNKEYISAQKRIPKHCCLCDCHIRSDNFSHHIKTQKHIKNESESDSSSTHVLDLVTKFQLLSESDLYKSDLSPRELAESY